MVSAPKARGLRLALRDLVSDSGRRQDDVARQAGMSTTNLNRILRGHKLPSSNEVAAILGALGATEEAMATLTAMADQAEPTSWLADVPGLPRQLATLIEFDSEAEAITEVTNYTMPGLAQTEPYARAVFQTAGVPESEIGRRVEFRRLRQQVLTRAGTPPAVHFLIDQSVLFRPLGGPKVLIDQLRALQVASERTNVTVRIIPHGARNAPVDGSYVLLEFADHPPLVHVEHPAGGLFQEGAEAERLVSASANIRAAALSPSDSDRLIATALSEWEMM